jgi:hypothetical protein
VGPTPGKEDDRLEEACLAGGIRTEDELGTSPEGGVERGVSPEVDEPQ